MTVLTWMDRGRPLLQRFGPNTLLAIGLIVMICRSWAFVLVPENNPTWMVFIYCIELFRGISNGCLQIGAVQICAHVGGESRQTTAQGIYYGIYSGFSGLIGCIATAIVLEKTDNDFKMVFWICSLFLSVFLVFGELLPQLLVVVKRRVKGGVEKK
jgi:MFS family permease